MKPADQFGLFGFEPLPREPARRARQPSGPEKGNCRLFFALFPTAEAVAQLQILGQHLKKVEGLHGRLHTDNRFHLTLDHLGDFAAFPEEVVSTAMRAAARVAARPFNVRLDQVMSFNNRSNASPVVVKEAGRADPALAAFRAALWRALAQEAVPGTGASFTPHVTLLYDAKLVPAQAVHAVEWIASDFVLIRSFLRETRYEEIGRWSLQPG